MSRQTEKVTVIAGGSTHPESDVQSGLDTADAVDVPEHSGVSSSSAPRKRFTAHVAWTLAARLLMAANSMLASIVVSRWLGAEGVGALAVLNVTVALALHLGSAGLPSASVYFIARERKLLGPSWANALVYGLTVGGALALGITGLASWRPSLFGHVSLELVVIAAISIPFQLITLLGLNTFLAVGRVSRFNLLDTLAQSFTLINAVAALVLLGAGLGTLVSLNTGAAICVGLLIVWLIGRLLMRQTGTTRLRADAQLLKRMVGYGLKFHVSVVAWMLILRVDLLIVNHFRGTTEAGVYAVASQVAMMLLLLPGVVGTLLMPRITSEPDVRGRFTMRATRHTAFVMLIVCLAAAPASLLLPVLYGAQFTDASLLLLILLPGVYLIGIEGVLVQHFNSMGLPAAIPLFWLITLVINVALNLMFVPTFGARAAAINSTICYATIFILVASYFRIRTGNPFTETLVLRSGELRALFGAARASASKR